MIEIELGARGNFTQTKRHGSTEEWKLNAEFEYKGFIIGIGTKHHLFRSVVGGYEMTVSEWDFLIGEVCFSGSDSTQFERRYKGGYIPKRPAFLREKGEDQWKTKH